MTALEDLVPDGHVLRLSASYERLPEDQCAVPGRCVREVCERCYRAVHYDPAARIPLLGPEFVLCDVCLDEVLP